MMDLKSPVTVTNNDWELMELNQKGLLRLCLVFIGMGGLNLLLALMAWDTVEMIQSAVITVFSVGLWFLSDRVIKQYPSPRKTLILFYSVAGVMLLTAIWAGSFDDPQLPAFTFPLYLLVLPIFLKDQPSRQMAFAGGMTALFLLCSFFAKDRGLFMADLRHMLIVLYVNGISVTLLIRDQTETILHEQKLKDTTFRDAMTGLYNKRGVERVCSMLENGVEGALILLDLDHFKEVNDRFGHAVGDLVLNHVAYAMRRSFRSSDLLLRTGGDEFAIYAVGLIDRECVRDKLAQVRAAVADDARGCPHVTCSLGAAVWERVEVDRAKDAYEALFRRADAALYQAKESGRNCWVIAE